MRNLPGAIAAVLVAGTLAAPVAAESESETIRVEQAWARASIGTGRPAAAYVALANDGARSATLTGVSSPVAGRAEVHETTTEGETMTMAPAGPVEIPAGGRVTMKPGGLHIMLMALERSIDEGATLGLELRFADGSTLPVSAAVMGPGAMGPSP